MADHPSPVSAAARTAVGLVMCGVALTGCASPGGGASTHNDVSRCAAVLPTARDLVHGQGRLVLVRPLRQADADTIARDAGQPAPASAPPSPPTPTPVAPSPGTSPPTPGRPHRPQAGAHPGTPAKPKLCLVAYEGNFRADSIPGAQPATATGRYALIFLQVRHPSVDRILITDVLPASSHRPWWHF
jgi:hypothetical protein